MEIRDFERQHIEEAKAIALACYCEEQHAVKALPTVSDIPDLSNFAENGLGIAAFDGGDMVGFLTCCSPFNNAFGSTDVKGIFSPMGAHAAVPKNRSKIYAAMYQAAGAKWVRAGAVSHAICLYAHDEELQRQFYRYGFGLRCMGAIRPMELIDCKPCAGYDFYDLSKDDYHLVHPLDMALNHHLSQSPFFANRRPETREEFISSSLKEGARYFVAKQNSQLCAFLKISASGETFAASGDTYRHINGAYCLPEHRGKGVYQNLLNFTISTLKKEGYTQLGVDFESINPAAFGFWLKYFTAYSHGVVRRIDERILQLG